MVSHQPGELSGELLFIYSWVKNPLNQKHRGWLLAPLLSQQLLISHINQVALTAKSSYYQHWDRYRDFFLILSLSISWLKSQFPRPHPEGHSALIASSHFHRTIYRHPCLAQRVILMMIAHFYWNLTASFPKRNLQSHRNLEILFLLGLQRRRAITKVFWLLP